MSEIAEPQRSIAARETARTRLLLAFVGAGLAFMLVPGTFLGVVNLIQISGREGVSLVSPAWIQAHGHAQVFGWIGSFMLGIGFYSVPVRADSTPSLRHAWACWMMWTAGVAMRWVANVYAWHWRVLLPISAALELAAFLVFVHTVSRHRVAAAGESSAWGAWMWAVMAGTAGWVVTLVLNFWVVGSLASRGTGPALPHGFDQHFLTLLTWGVLAPFLWGFSARWMPVLLGLDAARRAPLAGAIVTAATGIGLTFAGASGPATGVFVSAAVLAIVSLRMFEPATREPKTRGVHASFPVFVRLAYGWLLAASVLAVAAARWDTSGGIWGASRHAFTVGFTATMVFVVGQRMLPAFAGHRVLWSPRLMLGGLALLTAGCALRVSAEILAYQGYVPWTWSVLPVSAVIELGAVVTFGVNLFATLWM